MKVGNVFCIFDKSKILSLAGENMVMIYLLTPFVIQSEAKNLENILADVFVYVTEILPPFGRLNDKIVS